MKRPLHIWLVFAGVVLLALASFAWLSHAVLDLDDAQRRLQAEAEREEKVRLALWRMDSALSLLMAGEDARAPLEYRSFHSPARAWTQDNKEVAGGGFRIPSPLLAVPSTNTRLHFEFIPNRPPTSPQVPPPSMEPLVLELGIPLGNLLAASNQLEVLRRALVTTGKAGTSWSTALIRAANAGATNALPPSERTPFLSQQADTIGNYGNELPGQQAFLNRSEANARQQVFNNGVQTQQRNAYGAPTRSQGGVLAETGILEAVGRVTPVWIGEELFLVRRADFSTGQRIQGVWLDWPSIRSSLLQVVHDLIPAAHLTPVAADTTLDDTHLLASLPLRLDPGPIPGTAGSPWTALRLALWAAWACLAFATAALAVLLSGILALSERRAEFVSAVTHELRTPLTTFRLYSEMLADGMVPEGEPRQRYLATLCAEASRLGHLVENVLAYAKLERGNGHQRREKLPLSALIDRVLPRLTERASLAGMKLRVDLDPSLASRPVEVDVGVVEQILFNLVDNASKYGLPESGEPCIHLEALPEKGKFALLRVRDEGHGISPDVVGRLFEPFHRSAEKAAGSAPGVGLGLALCRKLSRSLGGDLRQDRSVPHGAAFVLSLPHAVA
jgi:signal transduction histidine kinase